MKEKDMESADHQRELDEEQRMIESEIYTVKCGSCDVIIHTSLEPTTEAGLIYTCGRCIDKRDAESEQRLKRRKENAQDHNDADAKSGDHHRSPWEYL
jgi:hypothetical protein